MPSIVAWLHTFFIIFHLLFDRTQTHIGYRVRRKAPEAPLVQATLLNQGNEVNSAVEQLCQRVRTSH